MPKEVKLYRFSPERVREIIRFGTSSLLPDWVVQNLEDRARRWRYGESYRLEATDLRAFADSIPPGDTRHSCGTKPTVPPPEHGKYTPCCGLAEATIIRRVLSRREDDVHYEMAILSYEIDEEEVPF